MTLFSGLNTRNLNKAILNGLRNWWQSKTGIVPFITLEVSMQWHWAQSVGPKQDKQTSLSGTYLALHWIGVYLAHVESSILQLNALDMKIPGWTITVGYRDTRIVGYYVIMNRLNCFCIRFNPSNLNQTKIHSWTNIIYLFNYGTMDGEEMKGNVKCLKRNIIHFFCLHYE